MNIPSLLVSLSVVQFLSLNASTVAHYHLDNDYLDSSGNNFHGTGVGGLAFTTSTAPSADAGSHALNARVDVDFVTVPHNASFSLNTFTLEAMVRVPENYTNTSTNIGVTSQYVAHKQRSTGTGNSLSSYGISIDQSSGVARSTAALNTGGVSLAGSNPINDNEWHHLALTFNGSSLTLFLDGVIEAQTNQLTGTILQGNAPFLIGAGNFGTINGSGTFRRNFQGDIDEVRLTDAVLSADQFLSIPEPTSAALILLSSLSLLKRRRLS